MESISKPPLPEAIMNIVGDKIRARLAINGIRGWVIGNIVQVIDNSWVELHVRFTSGMGCKLQVGQHYYINIANISVIQVALVTAK